MTKQRKPLAVFRRGAGREELFPLFEEFNFAELQASAGSHLNKLETIVAERTGALRLETILLFVLVTKSASAFLLVENSPVLLVVRAAHAPCDGVTAGICVRIVACVETILVDGRWLTSVEYNIVGHLAGLVDTPLRE